MQAAPAGTCTALVRWQTGGALSRERSPISPNPAAEEGDYDQSMDDWSIAGIVRGRTGGHRGADLDGRRIEDGPGR
jgi:hypothetical protein